MDQSKPSEFADARSAAERAEAVTAWVDAADGYERALSVIADDASHADDEIALLTALGRCYWFDAQIRPAWRALRRAISLASERGDGVAMARATVEILRIWGPPDRQRAMANDALTALGEAEPHLRALLLLRSGRRGEAIELGEKHAFADVLEVLRSDAAWTAMDAGRVDESVRLLREAHDAYARLANYETAAGQLRGLGFRLLQLGRIDDGLRALNDTLLYSRSHHLRFTEQLALIDVVGVAFARNDFTECERLLAEMSGGVDFRADLYRMWMAQQRGDIERALGLLVEPAAGGGALTALSQIHCAAAGMFYSAGRDELAARELEEWAAVAREGMSFPEEAPVATDALVALGSEALVREVRDAIARRDAESTLPDRYCTLQGRSLDVTRGELALRLGELEEARKHFEAGLAWAQGERCPVDAGRNLRGLGAAALEAGDVKNAQERFGAAIVLFDETGARYELERTQARLATTGSRSE